MAKIKSDTIARAKMRHDKARELVAYLSYAVEDLRQVSPASTHLLEMSIAAINEDLSLSRRPLPNVTAKG
jgi:hypothetical protein